MSTLSLNDDGLVIPKQDLDTVVPDADDDGRLFQHNGNSIIDLVGGDTSSETGFYAWDNGASAWDPLENTITDADTLDGYDSADFVLDDGSVDADTLDGIDSTGFVDVSGDTMSGALKFANNDYTHGANGGGIIITETTSPKSFNYDANASRDIQDAINLTISNSSSSSVTEDVTVELYEGSDTTGTLLNSETQSVTVASGSTSTVGFLTKNEPLGTVTYHVEVTTSGSTLAIDQTDVDIHGASYTFTQDGYGKGVLRTQSGRDLLKYDPITQQVTVPSGKLDVVGDFDVGGNVQFDLNQASSGTASSGDVPKADGVGSVTWSASSGFSGTADNLSVTNWNIIDVGNHGFPGDQTGGDLAQFVADNTSLDSKTLFILPEGTYDWLRSVQFTGDSGGTYDEDRPHTFVMIGKPKATLHVDIGASVASTDRTCFYFGNNSTGLQRVGVENINVDVGFENEDRDAGFCRAFIEDQAHFENITMTRRHRVDSVYPDTKKNGDRFSFKLDCMNPDANARMERIKLRNGDVHVSDGASVGHAIPFSSGDYHEGRNTWINCYVHDFTDNGFYVRDGHGSNYLKNCTAKDCGAGMFRLGLNDRAENITSIIESPSFNATPIWCEVKRESVNDDTLDDSDYVEGDERSEPCVVDGFDIDITAADNSNVNDCIRVTSNLPECVIQNGFIHCEVDEFLVDCSAHTGSLTLRNIQFDDYASGATRVAAIRLNQGNVLMEGCTYRPYPGSDNGRSILRIDGGNIRIRDNDLFGTYKPALEVYDEANYQLRGNEFDHDGSTSSPYLIRHNQTPDAAWIIDNDLRGYSSVFGSSSASSDYSFYEKRGNRGL